MLRIVRPLLAGIVPCVVSTGSWAAPLPPSILGDTFQLTVSIPDQGVLRQSASGIAGIGSTLSMDLPQAPVDPVFKVDASWIGRNTVVVTFANSLFSSAQDLNVATLSFTGLDFRRPGSTQPVAITGASFNPTGGCNPGSCFRDFFASPDNPTAPPLTPSSIPRVTSFSAHSVDVAVDFLPSLSVADRIPLAFDVRTAAITPVPEPSTYATFGIGLGLLAFWRRRRNGATASGAHAAAA